MKVRVKTPIMAKHILNPGDEFNIAQRNDNGDVVIMLPVVLTNHNFPREFELVDRCGSCGRKFTICRINGCS